MCLRGDRWPCGFSRSTCDELRLIDVHQTPLLAHLLSMFQSLLFQYRCTSHLHYLTSHHAIAISGKDYVWKGTLRASACIPCTRSASACSAGAAESYVSTGFVSCYPAIGILDFSISNPAWANRNASGDMLSSRYEAYSFIS